jgi:hypothetical protein
VFKRWQKDPTKRWQQTLNPAAFLVNQDRRMPANTGAQLRAQRLYLWRRGDIAAKQDKTQRLALSKKEFLINGQGKARTAQNASACLIR